MAAVSPTPSRGAKNLWTRTGRFWNLDLGTYNGRSLAWEGDIAEKLEELKGLKWDIIGLSEVRRLGEAYIELSEGHIFCYRGREDRREHGVGFLINKHLAGNIIEFYGISERVAGLVVKLNQKYKMKIVQVYAPTSTYEDEEVESFYEDVEAALNKHKTQFTFVMGDFNAKVGTKKPGEAVIGNFGVDSRNSRGDLLVEFAARNNLKIMNTFFKKRASRKWTWRGPNGEVKNEIDFILSGRIDVVKDVSVINKLKSSDHRMVRCKVSLNLTKERVRLVNRKPINKEAVRENIRDFRLRIENKFSQLNDEAENDKDEMNNNLTKILIESALEVGGKVKSKVSGKLSQNTKDLIQQRKDMRIKTTRDKVELAELSKTINKRKIQDIRKFNVAKVEEALRKGSSTKLARRRLGIGKHQLFVLKDSNGVPTNNRDEIVKIAEDFYLKLFNTNNRHKNINNSDSINLEVPEVTIDEIRNCLRGMKRGKAGGEDGITIDLIIDAGDVVLIKLARLYTNCFQTCSVPSAWKNFIMILIHKKGDIADLKNYRPISLLSVIYKLFTKLLTNRISGQLDFNQPREQAGFRSGFSTTDHIHAINQLVEKSNEYNKPLCMAFIDFEKAFDSVETWAVMQALRNQGIEERYVKLLEDIYRGSTATIKLHKTSDKIPIKKGVRQGDTISPKLFTACLEEIFKKLNWEGRGIKVDGEYLNNLRFADDIVIVCETAEELQQMIEELHMACIGIGLKMNMKKTKVMFNNHAVKKEIKVVNDSLETVNEYNYLGQVVYANPGHESEIKRRISLGWRAFGKQIDIMKSKLPLSLKRKVFNQQVLPVLTYGSESWSLTKTLERKLRTTQRGMERIMVGVTLRDRKRASWIREQTRVDDVIGTIKKKKWTWAGHVMRRRDNRWTVRLTEWQPRDGKRSQGRQRTRWRDEIKRFAGINWTTKALESEK